MVDTPSPARKAPAGKSPREQLHSEIASLAKKACLAALKSLNDAELANFYGRLRLGQVSFAAAFTDLINQRAF